MRRSPTAPLVLLLELLLEDELLELLTLAAVDDELEDEDWLERLWAVLVELELLLLLVKLAAVELLLDELVTLATVEDELLLDVTLAAVLLDELDEELTLVDELLLLDETLDRL